MENEKVEEDYFARLPNHLLPEIFERLSAMDFTTCWYVSKTWRSFVKDSYLSKFGTPNFFYIRHVCDCEQREYMDMISLGIDSKNVMMKVVNRYKMSDMKFENSCNGLLSLQNRKTGSVYILNPMTGEFLQLPITSTIDEGCVCLYGLGFSRESNIYKMIRLIFQPDGHPTMAEICTIDVVNDHNMTWRNIGPMPYCSSKSDRVYFNGALHWIAGDRINESVIICCYDLENEQFQHICFPFVINYDSKNLYAYIQTGVLGGDFCFHYIHRPTRTIHIWVMKDYSLNGLWTKHLVIQPPVSIYRTIFSLIKSCDDEEILMIYNKIDEHIALFNAATKEFRRETLYSGHDMMMKKAAFKIVPIMVTLSFSSLRKLLGGKTF